MQVEVEPLKSLITAAFEHVPVPDEDDILAARSRNSIDAGEFQVFLRGKSWMSLPIKELFQHREMLSSLSAVGFRGYVGAYLTASLIDGPYEADLLEYTLFSLHPHGDHDRDTTRERHLHLDQQQRAAIEAYLVHASHRSREAARALLYWSRSQ